MQPTQYPDSESHATEFRQVAFDLEVRRQTHVHASAPSELPELLGKMAGEQQERLESSDARLRGRIEA